MSLTNSTDLEENWVLLQSRYDYIALPISLGLEVMKVMKVVTKAGSKIDLSTSDATATIVSGEQMKVALVKSKMLPKEDE